MRILSDVVAHVLSVLARIRATAPAPAPDRALASSTSARLISPTAQTSQRSHTSRRSRAHRLAGCAPGATCALTRRPGSMRSGSFDGTLVFDKLPAAICRFSAGVGR